MRGLVSPTCLLFQIVTILAVFSFVSGVLTCNGLDENSDLLKQMATCEGSTFQFKEPSKASFDLSKLDQKTANKILYEDNDPNLPKKFIGHVRIIDSALDNLFLATDYLGQEEKIEIVGNTKLIGLKLRIGKKLTLILKGNKQLSMRSIRNIKKIDKIDTSSSTIQEFQDCSFSDGKVKNLAELEGCSTVEGDLIINENTVIPNPMPSIEIEKIRKGCLRIENSQLTSIDFLKGLLVGQTKAECNGQSHIKGNKQLCIPSEDWPKWNAVTTLSYAGTCRDRCSLDFALANKDATTAPCDVVVGDVKITGDHRRRRQSGVRSKLAHWDRVKELEGTLEVSNTNLENIVIFNNLEKIANPSPDKIALTVMRNPKMIKFDLPKLDNITQPSNSWSDPMFVDDNGNFTFPPSEVKKWERITGRSNLLVPVDLAALANIAPTTPTATTLSSKQKEIMERNAEVQRNQGWIIAGVACGLFLAVLLIGAIIVVVVCRVSFRGKSSKEDKDLASSAHLLPVVKKSKTPKKEEVKKKGGKKDDKKQEVSEDLTLAVGSDTGQHSLEYDDNDLLVRDSKSIEPRQNATRIQIALEASEIPFKMADIIMNIDAPELDIKKAQNLLKDSVPKMKHKGKPYRHVNQYKILFFNPKELNREPVEYMEKYDRIAVFKCLLTRCSEFFVMNAHLLPDVIADCSGPYYTPQNSLLVEIEGPVYVIGDIHEALHVLQTILNLDLNGEGRKYKTHPMFRNKYLFLGDYLDRGEHGFEVYFLLCIACRLFPELFTVLRGNHDGRVPKLSERNSRMISYGARLAAEKESIENQEEENQKNNVKNDEKRTKIENPLHFAECMVLDIHTKITAFLPMAAIVNGHTFAAHGGFTLGMVISKKSIREIFKEIPVPYYDEIRHKQEMVSYYYPDGFVSIDDKYTSILNEDKYTKRIIKMTEDLRVWGIGNRMYKKGTRKVPDPRYESAHPGLNMIMWSDPNPTLASAGNHRGSGCTFTTELVQKVRENNRATDKTKSIEDIIRAHQVVGFAQSYDHRVTTIFTNCDNVQESKATLDYLECPASLEKCASILRINEDGTRTIILLAMTTEKGALQALVNPNKKIKRQIEEDDEKEKKKEARMKEKEKELEGL